MTFVCKISVFTCKLRADLNWLFVLGHSLLRPTSNNLKNVLPEILRCLVPECPKSSAWILTPFPPGVWAVRRSLVNAWETSIAAPILSDTDQHWTLFITFAAEPLLFLHRSSTSVGGRAGSPLPPCLSTKNKFGVCCACCRFSLYYLCHVGYSSEWECTKLGFILRERGLGPLCNLRGWVCGLVCARPYREGRHPSPPTPTNFCHRKWSYTTVGYLCCSLIEW